MEGKTYTTLIHYTCKKMAGGGCAISTFSILSFKKDTVDVWERTVASCTPESLEAKYSHDGEDDKKSYRWRKERNTLIIDGFSEYGTFVIDGATLVADKGRNEEDEPLVFVEE